jgi:hypothetical protein
MPSAGSGPISEDTGETIGDIAGHRGSMGLPSWEINPSGQQVASFDFFESVTEEVITASAEPRQRGSGRQSRLTAILQARLEARRARANFKAMLERGA